MSVKNCLCWKTHGLFLSPRQIKEKIKHEAVNLKMLKEKKGGTLPV